MQILVRNIDRSVTESELLEIFRKFGKVRAFDLVMDVKTGVSKGFGFADMSDLTEASRAIQEMNGKKLKSCVLRVKRAAHATVARKHPGH